jgi:alpha-glucosidase
MQKVLIEPGENLMPMMQFSVAPWRVLDEEHLKAVQKSIAVRT